MGFHFQDYYVVADGLDDAYDVFMSNMSNRFKGIKWKDFTLITSSATIKIVGISQVNVVEAISRNGKTELKLSE